MAKKKTAPKPDDKPAGASGAPAGASKHARKPQPKPVVVKTKAKGPEAPKKPAKDPKKSAPEPVAKKGAPEPVAKKGAKDAKRPALVKAAEPKAPEKLGVKPVTGAKPAPAPKKGDAKGAPPAEAAKGAKSPPAKSAPAKAPPMKANTARVAGKAGAKRPARGVPEGAPVKPPRADLINKTTSLADARAAASRLAAVAGLKLVKPKASDLDSLAPAAKPLTKTPLSRKELTHYKDILLKKRSEVAGDVNAMESEALTSSGSLSSFPQHLADQGSDEYDQSLSLGLAESQRKLLGEIDAALARIEKGTYGVCEVMGTPINGERLEATPWSKHSLEGARMLDRRALYR